MRNHLYVAPEIFTGTLAVENCTVNLPAGGKIGSGKILIEHSLVSPQVHIRFHSVIENKNLTMTKRVKRTRIYVEITFQLDRADYKPFVLQEFCERG